MASSIIPSGADLLWTNSNPTVKYETEYEHIDLSKYKYILITFIIRLSGMYRTACFVPVDGASYLASSMSWDGSKNIACGRHFRAEPTYIRFGFAYRFEQYSVSTADNTYLVPYQVYGIN
jgi:hypothetical protein